MSSILFQFAATVKDFIMMDTDMTAEDKYSCKINWSLVRGSFSQPVFVGIKGAPSVSVDCCDGC